MSFTVSGLGVTRPLTHVDTAARVTFTCAASSVWVIPCRCN